MRYLASLLLLFFALFSVAQAAPEKRSGGKRSSLPALRQKPKYNLKPLVYNPKKHRPAVVKSKKPRRP